MNDEGSTMSSPTMPVSSTTMEKARPSSEVKVMAPNHSGDMKGRVQYRPVIQE